MDTHDNKQPKWIWNGDDPYESHQLVLFRRTFSCTRRPQRAVLRLTANVWYEAYVNGHRVGRGPSQGDLTYRYVDRFNVAGKLRTGGNVVAVLVYCTGHRRKSRLMQERGPGALWVELSLHAGRKIRHIVSDGRWRAMRPPGWSPKTKPQLATMFRGTYKEHIDARRFPADWHEVNTRSRGWRAARPYHPTADGFFTRLIPREIPHLSFGEVKPANAYSVTDGMAYGFGDSTGWEVLDPQVMVDADAASASWNLLTDGENRPRPPTIRHTTVLPGKAGFKPVMLLDFGRLVFGRPRVELDADAAGGVALGYGESLDVSMLDRFDFGPGRTTLGPVQDRFFRYLMLQWQTRRPVKVHGVVAQTRRYPARHVGTFECNDATINRAWEVGVETTHLTMYDHFVDCPFREHGLYWDDLAVQAQCAYHAFGDHRLLRKCLRQGAWIQKNDGRITSSIPELGAEIFLVDFVPHYIQCVWLHHMFSGSDAVLRELWPTVRRAIQWYKGACDNDGLLDISDHLDKDAFGRSQWWCFHDWSFVDKRGMITGLNCLYFRALSVAGKIARVVGDDDESRRLTRLERRLGASIRKRMWSSRRSAWVDCVSGGKASRHCGEVTNALAVWTGVANQAQTASALRLITNPAGREHVATGGPMVMRLVDTLFNHGRTDAAFARMDGYWLEMVRRGADAYWEIFTPRWRDNMWPHRMWSKCHGWSAGILPLLHRHVLGVQPTQSGARALTITPQPGPLEYARGTVPTAMGPVHVQWRKRGGRKLDIDVDAPKGVQWRRGSR